VFDAVDPKPVPPDHPRGLTLAYRVLPRFRDRPGELDPPLKLSIDLPIAAPPTQTPTLVGAGIALSPYRRSGDYASTEARERMLWLEFDAPPDNPADSYFARVLAYAPDPVLTRGAEVEPPPEPPLPIDPEPIRVIRPGQSDDRAGLSAMQPLLPTDSPRHFLVPLPPGLQGESRELFGFFVYEVRVGHAIVWSTARARFGPALRVTGVQHPAPILHCQGVRATSGVVASSSYANPVFEGRSLLPPVPATELWIVLYARVVRADGADHRNIQLGRRLGHWRREKYRRRDEVDLAADVRWSNDEVVAALRSLGLAADTPLGVLAVELIPELVPAADPLGADLGQVRILRTSPLVPLQSVCPDVPCPWP
jgi:hypothetical protein